MNTTYSLGEDIFVKLTITDETGAVVDLTNAAWEVWFGLFTDNHQAWADAIVTKSIGAGGITKTDAANGEVEIHIDDVDTEDENPGTYFGWIKARNPTGYEWDVVKREIFKFEHSPLKNL